MGEKTNGALHMFCIEAKPNGGSFYRIMHRYNDFHTLNGKLGELANNLFEDAPFPGKFEGAMSAAWCLGNSDCEQERLNKRRAALQTWLQRVLKDPECNGLWKEPLQEFLHPEAKVGTSLMDGLKRDALSVTDKVMTHAKVGYDSAKSGMAPVVDTVMTHPVVDKVMTHAKYGIESAKSGIASTQEKMAPVVDQVMAHAKSGIESAMTGMAPVVDKVMTHAKSGIESAKSGIASTKEKMAPVVDKIMTHAKSGIESAKSGIASTQEKMAPVVDQVMTHAKYGIESAKSGIASTQEKMAPVVDKVMAHAKSGIDSIRENAKSGTASIQKMVVSNKEEVGEEGEEEEVEACKKA